MEKSWKRKKEKEEYEEGEKERKKEEKRERGREKFDVELSPRPNGSPSLPLLIYRRYPSTLRALVRARSRPQTVPILSYVYVLTHTEARTESRSHPPAARGPARPTPSRQPSLGRRVPALSVFPRPVPTTPFHAVSRRACPYTQLACNCPLYRL